MPAQSADAHTLPTSSHASPVPFCTRVSGNWQARIALLEGERRGTENLKTDLMRRVKMLEYALRQERNKYLTNAQTQAAQHAVALKEKEKEATAAALARAGAGAKAEKDQDKGQDKGDATSAQTTKEQEKLADKDREKDSKDAKELVQKKATGAGTASAIPEGKRRAINAQGGSSGRSSPAPQGAEDASSSEWPNPACTDA